MVVLIASTVVVLDERFKILIDLLQKWLNCHVERSETSLRFLATLRFATNDIHDFLNECKRSNDSTLEISTNCFVVQVCGLAS
ncbi:hypothetical protein SAMD00079811_07240 [Scytonema sp. HK-05]|nr:hypothetical protein SAMD00079811_07240 [Scytonema sp. HK-05]